MERFESRCSKFKNIVAKGERELLKDQDRLALIYESVDFQNNMSNNRWKINGALGRILHGKYRGIK